MTAEHDYIVEDSAAEVEPISKSSETDSKAILNSFKRATSSARCDSNTPRMILTGSRQLMSNYKYKVYVSTVSTNALAKAARAEASGITSKALVDLYVDLRDLIRKKKFSEVDQLLSSANHETTSSRLLLGVLTATHGIRQHLKNRKQFYAATKKMLVSRGEYERGILRGLK